YPKPAIFALTSGSASEDRVPIAIDDPDKLCFYTSTDATEPADSNTWRPVQTIDFDALRPEEVSAPEPAPNTSGDPAAFQPAKPDGLVRPGLGRFTFALEKGEATWIPAAELTLGRSGTLLKRSSPEAALTILPTAAQPGRSHFELFGLVTRVIADAF